MLSMGVPKRVRLGSKPLFWRVCAGFAHTVPFRAQECWYAVSTVAAKTR